MWWQESETQPPFIMGPDQYTREEVSELKDFFVSGYSGTRFEKPKLLSEIEARKIYIDTYWSSFCLFMDLSNAWDRGWETLKLIEIINSPHRKYHVWEMRSEIDLIVKMNWFFMLYCVPLENLPLYVNSGKLGDIPWLCRWRLDHAK
jgi:hypothetical protein